MLPVLYAPLCLGLGAVLSPVAPPEALVLESVRIAAPGSAASTAPRSILIVRGAIVSIEDDLEAPAGARVVDARGLFVAPGFYDMHVHLPGPNEDVPAYFVGPALDMMLEHGITTARVGRGAPRHLDLRARIERSEVRGPRLLISAPPLSRSRFPSLDEARSLFRIQRAQGYDFVKFLSAPESLFERGATPCYADYVHAARDAGLDFVGHVPRTPEGARVDLCALPGQASVEHASALSVLLECPPHERATVFAALARERVALDLNLEYYAMISDMEPLDALLERPELGRLPREVLDAWTEDRRRPDPRRALRRRLVEGIAPLGAELRAAGVPLVLSASVGPFLAPGACYVREARRTLELGYAPTEILAMATIEAARVCGDDTLRGTVEIGKVADLVLLGSDPLESVEALADVAMTLVGGRVVYVDPQRVR
ncbi:MAG: amidohydrolase family protein [Planctomycetota bacterium]